MLQQIFLSRRKQPLPGWLAAFPHARVRHYPSPGERLAAPGAAIVWLHIDNQLTQPESLVATLRQATPDCPLVALANLPQDDEGLRVLDAGAAGYSSAIAVPGVLRQIEAVVAHGGLWVGPELLQRLLRAVGRHAGGNPDTGLERLSPREREVARAVAAGATNKEIARQLEITERTVKAHLSQVFETLQVRDRLQLAIRINGMGPPTA